MTRSTALLLLLVVAAIPSVPAHAQTRAPRSESRPMSDAIQAEVAAALAAYDKTPSADALQQAADALVRDDGVPPADPAQGLALARVQLALWMQIFARLQRDVAADFDPARPPPVSVAPPEIDGAQLMPGTKPADIKDPVARAKYEALIAENARRVQLFTAAIRLDAIRPAMRARAADSLRNARDLLGLPAAEIAAALAAAAIAPTDRAALQAALAG